MDRSGGRIVVPGKARRRWRRLPYVALAAMVIALFAPAGADAGVRDWEWKRFAQRDDTRREKVSLGGGYVGRVKLIDNLVALSKRYRNAKGKKRKRLYQVSSALSVRLKDGYDLIQASCKIRTPGAQLVPMRDGTRAFFPQEADEAPSSAGGVNVGVNLGPFSVSVPVPGLDLFSGPEPPQIGWEVPRSSAKHKWLWFFNPFGEPPNDELLPFLGHWVTSAKGITYKVVCKVAVRGYGATGGARIKMKRSVRT